MNKQLIWAHLALLTVNIIYGVNYSIAKELMPDLIGPFGFIFCRVIGALLLFWIFFTPKNDEKIKRKDWELLIVCGFFGIACNQLLFFYGLNLTTPVNAAIIMTTNPVLVLIMSAVLLKERISKTKILGIIIGLGGAVGLILHSQQFNFDTNNLSGDIFILLNAASYALYLVLVKPLMKRYKPSTVIKWVFLFGFVFVFPFGINEFSAVEWGSFSSNNWLSFLFVIICTTFIAYLFNIFGLKHLSPSVVSTYIYTQPLVATLVALILQKDPLDPEKIFFAIAIFAAVYLVSIRKDRQKAFP